MPVLTDAERVGTTVGGKYRLDRIIGRGGVGTVFAGVHSWTGREVAVKMLHPEHARERSVVDRFLTEARAAATLRHPNVVDVLDMGKDDDGTVYMVLEYLEGESLSRRISRRRQMTPDETASILLPVMDALAEAHDLSIVHRDIKPENVFVALDAKRRSVPKLLDFGIAKVIAIGGARATRTGMVVGTPAYMSPEQAEGAADVGPASDVWSMGVMFFECLTGLLPFPSESPTATLIAIVSTNAPKVRSVAPSVPKALADAVDRALSRAARDRWPDMRAFAAAITDSVGPSALQRPDPSGAFPVDSGSAPALDERTVVSPPPTRVVAPTVTEAAAQVPRAVPVTLSMGAPRAPEASTPFAGSDVPSRPRDRRVALGVAAAVALLLVGIVLVALTANPSPTGPASGGRAIVAAPLPERVVAPGTGSVVGQPAPLPTEPTIPPLTATAAPAVTVMSAPPRGVEPPPPTSRPEVSRTVHLEPRPTVTTRAPEPPAVVHDVAPDDVRPLPTHVTSTPPTTHAAPAVGANDSLILD